MTTKMAWIIVKIGWQYDDEWYYRAGESQEGKPVKAYTSQDEAVTVCDEMNRKAFEDNKNDSYPMQSNDSRAEDNLVDKFYEVVPVSLDLSEVNHETV